MKKTVLLFVFPIIFFLPSFGQVNEEYKEALKEMFRVSGSEESYKAAITQLVSTFKGQYGSVDANVWNEFEKEFLKTSLVDLVDMLAPVYAKYLSLSDLKEMTKFYNTPIGVKFAKNTPQIMQESMQVGQQWGMKIGQEFMQKMKDKGY